MGFEVDIKTTLKHGAGNFGSLISEFAGQEKAFLLLIGNAGNEMDVLALTPLRLLQVFSNVAANHDNKDAIHTDSLFSQLFPEGELSPTSAACLIGIVASLGIGLAVGLYQRRHKKYLQSFEYMAKQLKAVNPKVVAAAKKEFASDDEKVALLTYVVTQLIKQYEDKKNTLKVLHYKAILLNPKAMLEEEATILAKDGAKAAFEHALLLRKCLDILVKRNASLNVKEKNQTHYVAEVNTFHQNISKEQRAQYKLSGFVRLMSGNISKVVNKLFGTKNGGNRKAFT